MIRLPPMAGDSQIEDLLNFDPLNQAQNLTKKDYKNDVATSALGFALLQKNSEDKESIFNFTGDCHFRSKIRDYLRIMESIGFVQVASFQIVSDRQMEEGDVYRILWHPEGLLLSFDSYHGDNNINSGHVYFNLVIKNKRSYPVHCSGSFCSSPSHPGKRIFSGYFDAREGVLHRIASLQRIGEFIKPWVQRPFLWLLHYGECGLSGKYREINDKRISILPPEVREMIPEEEDD